MKHTKLFFALCCSVALFTACDKYEPVGSENKQDYVDLGLPSGTMWACCNLGAENPQDYGYYFAWGETSTKKAYCDSLYTYTSSATTLPTSNDVATKWGGRWRMPTKAEWTELCDANNCTWTWTKLKGVAGYQVKSKYNENSIFLPAAGYRNSDDCKTDHVNDAGVWGNYWTSSGNGTEYAWLAYFAPADFGLSYNPRYYGHSVRAVFK